MELRHREIAALTLPLIRRKNFSVDDQGRLTLFGRVVSGAINDRFILNIMHQFKGKIDPMCFRGYNGGYPAGADKVIIHQSISLSLCFFLLQELLDDSSSLLKS
jgi:hypothetical protein